MLWLLQGSAVFDFVGSLQYLLYHTITSLTWKVPLLSA